MASLSLIDLIKDRGFVDLVHNEVSNMFDDDHDVLFKHLNNKLALSSSSFINRLGQSLDTVLSSKYPQINNSNKYVHLPVSSISNNISNIINGIEVCNKKIYLQIYIPNFDSVDLNQTPIIAVAYDKDPVDCATFGYMFIRDSIFIIDIDSAIAANNLIWVVSHNDVVNDQGELPESFFKLADTASVSSVTVSESFQSVSRTDRDKQVRIHSIWLSRKNRKTCWLCSKDAVALAGFFSDYQWCRPVDVPRGIFTDVLCQIGKNDLNKWINIPFDKWRALIANTNSPLRKYNEAINFVWYTYTNRNRPVTFENDEPYCQSPLPEGMSIIYHTSHNDYGRTSYSGQRAMVWPDVPATSGMQIFRTYDWNGQKIRFEGSNVPF